MMSEPEITADPDLKVRPEAATPEAKAALA
jgi:hypothetical protein